jgi:Tol biopolymer transport system component
LVIAALVIVLAAAIAFATAYVRTATADPAPARFFFGPPDTAALVPRLTLAASPDGRRVAFIASRPGGQPMLWVRSLDALEAQPLNGTEGAVFPFWSPNSRTLAFFAGGKLKTIDASGGPVQALCDAVGYGGTWSADGVIVFAASLSGRLLKVPAAGGQPTPVTTLDVARKENGHLYPAFLPDGRHFLYFAKPANTIWIGSLDSNEATRVLDADSQAEYVLPGYLIFVRQGTLLAQPFDAPRARVTGDAVPIAQGLAPDATIRYATFSSSDSGVIAYKTGVSSLPTRLTWVDRTGKALGWVGSPGLYRNPALSPDGTRLAVEATDPQTSTQDVWLMELGRGVTSRFTFDPGNDIYPVWSADGSRIIFGSDRVSGLVFNLYQKLANGADQETLVLPSSDEMAPYSWSPDGRYVMYRCGLANQRDIGILSLIGDRTPRPFLPPRPNRTNAFVSPDGRWITYTSDESGKFEVYVQTFPVPTGKWQISQGGAVFPRWRRDSRELYYYASDGRLMAVPVGGTTTLDVGTPIPLFERRMLGGPTTGVNFRGQYVTNDGQRFLLNMPIDEAAPTPITVVLNWTTTLHR